MVDITLVGNEGAAYVRISDNQADTLRQYAAIHAFEQRHGVTVPAQHWFKDEGWARDTAATRPDFQRLIAAAEQGRIKWIVVSERDRFGTTDADELIHYRYRLRQAGCKLYDSAGTDWTAKNIATVITAVVEGEKSEQEQHSISKRVLGGMVQSARNGEWLGGPVRLGFDVACLRRDTGEELWRVVLKRRDKRLKVYPSGATERYDGTGNFPRHQDSVEKLQLVPTTDQAKLAAAVGVFERYAAESISFTALAHWLNGLGMRSCYGKPFESGSVRDMLSDPIYLGYATWSKGHRGKFHRYKDGSPLLEPNLRQRFSRNQQQDWVQSVRLFEPLVTLETWDAVRQKLATRGTRSKAPHSQRHYLSGLLVCANCGAPMVAATVRSPGRYEYVCGTYSKATRYKQTSQSSCLRNGILQGDVERFVERWLGETGTRLELLLGEVSSTGDALTGRLREQERDHWARFRDGLHRLTAYLAEHHPRQYAAVIDAFNRQCAADLAAAKAATRTAQRGDLLHHYGDRLRRAFQRAKEASNGTGNGNGYADDFVEAVVGCYRSNYDPAQAQAEMEALEREHTELIRLWQSLPTQRAKDKVEQQFKALEARMAELEHQMGQGAAEVAAHWREMATLQSAIADAKLALKSTQGERAIRQRAEALRKVVQRIECRFTAAQLQADKRGRRGGGPGNRGYRLASVTVHPIVGAAVEMGPNAGTANANANVQSRENAPPCRLQFPFYRDILYGPKNCSLLPDSGGQSGIKTLPRSLGPL
jgi:DNA invertase Pin-like site-specific DNA recombinase